MLDTQKRYAVMHTTLFGDTPHTQLARLYYCQERQSMQVEEYLLSVDRQGRKVVSLSVVWAGSPDKLLNNVEVLHEWSEQDDIQFKTIYDEWNAKLHFKQGKVLQTSLF